MPRPSKPTIRDVAKMAGVSVATVSYVLNDDPDETISEAVKKRVRDAVRLLNYHRAAAAVGLARQRTRNLGVVLYLDHSAVTNPFYSFVIQGIIREAMDRDYNLLFSYIESRYRGSQDLPKIVREANVAGLLLVSRIFPRMLDDLRAAFIPVVAIDNYPAMKGICSVQIANALGGELAARHLLELGHQHIAVIGHVRARPSIVQRCAGFVRTLRHAGLDFVPNRDVVACRTLAFGEGYVQARELLEKNRKVTAVFCANDEVASGALRAAHELGRKIPDDVSVVGFDNIAMSLYTYPPLTTIGVDKEQMGRRAASCLIDLIEGREPPSRKETLPVELVARASSGAASAKANAPSPRAGRDRGQSGG